MVCVITGASSGIGKQLARELSAKGVRLAIAARSEDKLQALSRELPGETLVVPTDVSEEGPCIELIERTREHFSRIDTLVANAGYGISKRVTRTSRQEMQDIWTTNVLGCFDTAKAAAENMKQQGERDGYRGQILFVTSAVARRGLPLFGPYAATKAAQLSLVEAMRVELADAKIAVSSVHPVGTDTSFFDVAEQRGDVKVQGRSSRGPQQSPQAVARAMVRCIERPRPECWPFFGSRTALLLAAMFPRLVDAGCRRALRELEA